MCFWAWCKRSRGSDCVANCSTLAWFMVLLMPWPPVGQHHKTREIRTLLGQEWGIPGSRWREARCLGQLCQVNFTGEILGTLRGLSSEAKGIWSFGFWDPALSLPNHVPAPSETQSAYLPNGATPSVIRPGLGQQLQWRMSSTVPGTPPLMLTGSDF